MNHFGIIKKSFEIALKNKFLWILGFLSGGFAIGFSKGFTTETFPSALNFNNISNEWVVLLSALMFFVVLPIYLVISFCSEGALINGYAEIGKEQKSSFRKSFRVGWYNFWRILGFKLLFALAVFVVIAVPASIIALLVILKAYALAIFLGIVLVLACILVLVLLSLVKVYGIRMVVLERVKLSKVFRESLHFVRDNILDVIIMSLLAYVFSLIYGLIIIVGALMIGVVLFGIGYAIYLASMVAACIYAVIAILAFAILIISVSSAYFTFNSGIFTLAYLKLKR